MTVDVVAELTDLEVAHGDAREAGGLGPLLASREVLEDSDAVPVEVRGQEDVHEEQLE